MTNASWRSAGKIARLGAAAAFLAVALPAHAGTEGFAFGFDLHSSIVGTVDASAAKPPGYIFIDQDGGGGTLWLGYGFTPSFPVRLVASGATHGTTDADVEVAFGSLTLEALYMFRNPASLRPYVLGGVGAYSVRSRVDEYDYETTGPGVVMGAGLMYFFNNTVAMDFGIQADFMNWDHQTATRNVAGGGTEIIDTPVEEDGGAAKVLLGMSFWL
jgi:hypothetical protein